MELPGWIRASVVAALAIAIAACDGSTPPPSSSDPPGTGERITGNERLGWNQAASSASELATFRYAAYVDGNRLELADVSCGAASGGGFSCSSRMPAMSPGAHTIELASFTVDGGTVVESGRSAALRVTVTGATPGTSPAPPAATTFLTTVDGVELRLDRLSDQLTSPTALAIAPDGRVFVAEREGRVRILRDGLLEAEPAIIIDDVVMTAVSEGGLMALALDAHFERTHFLYAVYTVAAADDTLRFRVVRYREVGGRLGERTVLLDRIPAGARPSASLGVGPDGRLYVAFGALPHTGRTAALASYNGKVLRLNTDGTTPRDQRAGLPIFASDFLSPRGLDWDPVTGALSVIDVRARSVEELRIVVASARDGSATTRARVDLPAGMGAAAIAFYRGTMLPALTGDIFLAAEEGRYLLRLRVDRRDPPRLVSSERLLQDLDSPIRAVAAAADGAVYVATDGAVLRLGAR